MGCEAVIRIDPTRPAFHTERGLLKTPDSSLAHELAHAVAITHGAFLPPDGDNFEATYRAPSREEAYAWIIENMYRREARYSIRNNYLDNAATSFAADPSDSSSGIPLRHLERAAVEHFRRKAAAFVTELERIPEDVCPYNPFRRHRWTSGARSAVPSAARRG